MTQHPHPNLGTPSKLVDGGLRIVALGGISEIGRNMTVYEMQGKLLIIDCGVLFPEDNQPGIDLILPDFSYIRDRLNDVVGIFLTQATKTISAQSLTYCANVEIFQSMGPR